MRRLFILIMCICVALGVAAMPKADSIAVSVPEKHKPWQIVTGAGSSLVLNAAFTEILKRSVHERRPDGSDRLSFPSRHTSWAFTASTILSNELYGYSPFYAVASHALATAVAQQRVWSNHHYGGDVLAGAALGVVSTELGYFIARKAFGGKAPWRYVFDNDFRPEIAVSTTGLFFVGDSRYRTTVRSSVGLAFPLSTHWGIGAKGFVQSTPFKLSPTSVKALNSVGGLLSGQYQTQLDCRSLAFVARCDAGMLRYKRPGSAIVSRWGFATDATAALSWALSRSFAASFNVGYSLMTTPRCVHAISVGVSSVAKF